MLFTFGITTSHHVTQFLITFIWITYYLFKRDNKTRMQLLIIIILFITWNLYSNLPYTISIISSFLFAFNTTLTDFMSSIVAKPVQESLPQEIGLLLLYRRLFYVLIPVLGFLGGYFYLKDRKPYYPNKFNVVTIEILCLDNLRLKSPIYYRFSNGCMF